MTVGVKKLDGGWSILMTSSTWRCSSMSSMAVLKRALIIGRKNARSGRPLAFCGGIGEVCAGCQPPWIGLHLRLGLEEVPGKFRVRRPVFFQTFLKCPGRKRSGRHALSIDGVKGAGRVAHGDKSVSALIPLLVPTKSISHGAVAIDRRDRLCQADGFGQYRRT